MIRSSAIALVLGLALPVLAPAAAQANERHFTYTYESATLPTGAKELELWTTPRVGRDDFYTRFEQRVELEVGLTDRLMTSFYLNFNSISAETEPGVVENEFEFAGVSSEWKYKFTDPVADAVGFALYGEVTAAPHEYELETKLIFDKRIGDVLLAANMVSELELEVEGEGPGGEVEAEKVLALEPVVGVTYLFSPGFAAGLELRNKNEIVSGELEYSALYAGPVVSYAAHDWWVAATVTPQLPALKHEGGGLVDLQDNERWNARLLFSVSL